MKLYRSGMLMAGIAALAVTGCGEPQTPAAAPGATTAAPAPELPVMGEAVPILAFGDSLFTGYGLKEGESYPARLEAALRARGINARIANAGLSGDTTAGALQRLDFTLNSQSAPPALAVVSLGGNDMLRGLPPAETRANLDRMLAELKRRDIPVLLLGMLAAPNLGKDYADAFNPIYPQLTKKHGAALVPFFLQPLMDRPDLVQADHVHPTVHGIDALVGASVEQVAQAVPTPPVPPPPR